MVVALALPWCTRVWSGHPLRFSGSWGADLRLGAISGPHAGRTITVHGQLTVGRAASCELRLDDPKVSRRHATLIGENGGLAVRDDGSLNGTWLNDLRIAGTAALSVGDRVRIGGSEFVVTGGETIPETLRDEVESVEPPWADETLLLGVQGGEAR
jgi:pSer/pThr/pTyr-binding forkhead associated (FHA) protein